MAKVIALAVMDSKRIFAGKMLLSTAFFLEPQ